MKKITNEELSNVRNFIIDKVIQNPQVMFNENIRDNKYYPDLVEVIVNLYELLHIQVNDREYDYMFHWANKIGSWVETDVNMLIGGNEK